MGWWAHWGPVLTSPSSSRTAPASTSAGAPSSARTGWSLPPTAVSGEGLGSPEYPWGGRRTLRTEDKSFNSIPQFPSLEMYRKLKSCGSPSGRWEGNTWQAVGTVVPGATVDILSSTQHTGMHIHVRTMHTHTSIYLHTHALTCKHPAPPAGPHHLIAGNPSFLWPSLGPPTWSWPGSLTRAQMTKTSRC